MEATSPRETLHRWLLAAGCFALLTFFFSPQWAAFSYWSRVPELGNMIEVRRAVSVLQQVEHPGAPIPDQLHGAIQWRLLFPLLGRFLHLPPVALLGLAHVGCLLTLAFIVTVLRRNAVPWPRTALVTTILGSAAWFFTSMCWLGYYDSWFALAVLVIAFADSRWAPWFACAWAPWVDERLVIAAPLAYLCRYIYRTQNGAAFDWKRELLPAGGLLALFVVVRLGVLAGRSGVHATPGGYLHTFNVLETPLPRILHGIWMGLRVGWILLAAGVALLTLRQRTRGLVLGGTVGVTIFVGIATAQDFGRSMVLVAPAALLGALLAARENPGWWHPTLAVGAAAALLLPAKHVVSTSVLPIFYLYQALDAYDNPPRLLMPEVIELQAIRALQSGDVATAEQGLTMAMRLAQNPAAPARQRGVLRGVQGRWKEARDDFRLVAQFEPRNPDAWMMCAQAELALNNPAGARENMQQALALAPPGWTTRPDVARFLARLEQVR